MYVSINAEIANIMRAMSRFEIYFRIAYVMFSLLLSLMIVLYIFIPLSEIKNIAGISIILLKNIKERQNISPFPAPNVTLIADIVYPKLNPLYPIIK